VMWTLHKPGPCAPFGRKSGLRTWSALRSQLPGSGNIEGQGAHDTSRAYEAKPGCGVKT
jgi:hypothetical protein